MTITSPHYFKKQEELEAMDSPESFVTAMLISDIMAVEPNVKLADVQIRIEKVRDLYEFWAYVEKP